MDATTNTRNGRHRPNVGTKKTTPEKTTGTPAAATPAPAADFFADQTPERMAAYIDSVGRLTKSRGCEQVQQIFTDAWGLQALITDTLQHYGHGTGSEVDKHLGEFDAVPRPTEVWDALLALSVNLHLQTCVAHSALPGLR